MTACLHLLIPAPQKQHSKHLFLMECFSGSQSDTSFSDEYMKDSKYSPIFSPTLEHCSNHQNVYQMINMPPDS